MEKIIKKCLISGVIFGFVLELFSLFLAGELGLYGLREFGEGLISISFISLLIFPLFTALLCGIAGYAYTTKNYSKKYSIIGFFIMFFIFLHHSITSPKYGELTGSAFEGFILLLLIPVASTIGYVYGKYKK